MNAIAAYVVAKTLEGGSRFGSDYPADEPEYESPKPRTGLRARVRKLFGARPRVVSEPGFAATHQFISDFVPPLRAYPFPPTYR